MCGFGGFPFLGLLILIGCIIFFFNRNRFCSSKAPADNEQIALAAEVGKLRREIDLLKQEQEEKDRS